MEILSLIQQLRGQTEFAVNGTCTPEFEPLMQALRQVIPMDRKGGVALAVYFRGQLVADLWMGLQQGATLWQEDTLSLSYSTGKGVLATLVHILVDKGYLDYDRPVREYWPEFGVLGKENITLRHLLSHSSGLYDIRHVIQSAEMMLDWDAMLKAYEQAIPRFEPNSASAYQAMSFGWLVGGVIEKVMQEPLAVTFERELVVPLGLTGEAYFGTPDTQLERVARPYRKAPSAKSAPQKKTKFHAKSPPALTTTQSILKFFGQDPLDVRDALVPKQMGQFDLFSDDALQACMPAFNGVFSARALAKIYAVLASGGEFEGTSYLSRQTMDQLSAVQHPHRDRIIPIPMSWRLGYHRVITMGKRVPNGFGHMGYNGSGAWCDPDRELSIAFVTSYSMDSIGGDPRFWWLSQRALQLADGVIKGRRGWL